VSKRSSCRSDVRDPERPARELDRGFAGQADLLEQDAIAKKVRTLAFDDQE
jgi:hypothetical protein